MGDAGHVRTRGEIILRRVTIKHWKPVEVDLLPAAAPLQFEHRGPTVRSAETILSRVFGRGIRRRHGRTGRTNKNITIQ